MRVPSWLSWLAAVASALGYGLTWYYSDALAPWVVQVSVVGLGYAFLWCTSGRLVEFVLAWADEEKARREREQSGETGPGAAAPDGGQEQAADPAADEATDGERAANGVDGADDEGSTVSQADRDVGTIVGKAENLLLPTFILAEAYTALSVIFAAKGLVRREDIRKNTLYYLAGTMTNFTYSVAVGFVVRLSLEALGVWQTVLPTAG